MWKRKIAYPNWKCTVTGWQSVLILLKCEIIQVYMCTTHLPIILCLSNCGNIICCRHYREVEIPLRQSQYLDEQSGFGKPGTSRHDDAFSRYEYDERTKKC